MVMPVLKGECKALFIEKFEIKERVDRGRNKGQVEIVGVLVLVWFGVAFCLLEDNAANAEEQGRDA
jgi:hypothetical protein